MESMTEGGIDMTLILGAIFIGAGVMLVAEWIKDKD